MASDIDEVKDIIAKSGNSFHCKILKYLTDREWITLISPYYNDNVSGKPREIDIIAEKKFPIQRHPFGVDRSVNIRLFIECKYISQKNVFWFHNIDQEKSISLVEGTSPFRSNNTYTNEHHYLLNKRVAKLFADEKSKTADNEVFYKALNQSLNALIYYRSRRSIIPMSFNRYDEPGCILNYPIIACNSFDNLYGVNIDTDDDPVKLKNNFALEVNYAYVTQKGADKNEYFLIDIVDFNLFDDLLDKVKKDADIAGFFLFQS